MYNYVHVYVEINNKICDFLFNMMLSYLIFRIAWDFRNNHIWENLYISFKKEYILLENNYLWNIALIIKFFLKNIFLFWLHKHIYPIICSLNYIIGRFLKDVTQFWNHRGHNSEHSLISILLMTLIQLYLKSASFVKDLKGFMK